MKKITLLLVMAISVMTISCSNDDDSSEPAEPTLTPALLAGTYNLNFYESEEVIQEEVSGGTVTSTITEVGSTFGSSNLVFDANGTYTLNFQYVLTTTRQVENNDPIVDEEIITISDSGTYVANDTEQTISFGEEPIDVTLFNENELRLSSTSTDVEDNATSNYMLDIRFSRQ